jgi:hypothetical protein
VGTTEKPQLPPQRRPAAVLPAAPPRPATAAPPRPATAAMPAAGTAAGPGSGAEIRSGLAAGVRAVAQDALLGRRPYLKMAFANPYNLSLVSGGLLAALLTANPLLALGTLGLEALWLLHAPDNSRLRHILWDPRFERLQQALQAQDRDRRLAVLSAEARARVEALVARQQDIRRLAAENPSFAGDLLRGELVKTDRLVDAFIEMALTCDRYESYLANIDAAGLERERRRYELAAGGPRDASAARDAGAVRAARGARPVGAAGDAGAQASGHAADALADAHDADPAAAADRADHADRAANDADAGDAGDQAARTIARRNLAVVVKRLDKLQEIRRYLTVAQGQLDLIENSFQLIADQIVTMQSPQELSGQLDELLDGVEAVRETSRETEQILAGIDRSL